MARMLGGLPILLLASVLAHSDISEDRLRQLSTRLSPDGLAGRLGETLKTEWGRKAVEERVTLLLAAPLLRARRDAYGLFEEHLFTADEEGNLTLRPERRPEIERIQRLLPFALGRFETFSRRLDEIGDRIVEENDLDRAAKAGWKDRKWRLNLFHHYVAGGLPDSDHDVEQAFETRVMLWLVQGPDGKLRVSGPGEGRISNLMREVYGLMDQAKKYEGPYLKLVAKTADPSTAKAAGADDVVLLACVRLAAEVRAEGGDALTRLVGLDPEVVLKEGEGTLRDAARLKGTFDAVAAALSEDVRSKDLKTFLMDDRARVVLVHRLTPSETSFLSRLDDFFSRILPAAWCDKQGDRLVFKRSLFRDGRGASTVESFRGRTYDTWTPPLRAMQEPFRSTAERCLEADVADLFRNADALVLLRQHVARVSEARVAALQDRGLSLFVGIHFAEREGRYVVRPEREGHVETLLARAEALRRQGENKP